MPWARATSRSGSEACRRWLRGDGSARPWLAAAATCDAVDFGATWTAGRGIPRQARTVVLAIAGVFALLSAIAAAGSGPAGDPALSE